MDAILCFGDNFEMPQWTLEDTVWKNALDYWYRKSHISNYYSLYEDMTRVTRGYPHVNFRYTIAPSVELPTAGILPIYGSQEGIQKHIEIGKADGHKAI